MTVAAAGGGSPAVPSYVPTQYRAWVAAAARATGLPTTVVAAQINEESGFNPNSTSPTGAEGIAQFEPSTWAGLGIGGSPYSPSAALAGYSKLMSGLLAQYHGNVRDALAAYNAGSGNLAAGMGYANTILQKAGQPTTLASGTGTGSGASTNSSTNSSSGSEWERLLLYVVLFAAGVALIYRGTKRTINTQAA